eukprot:TRINITY_DN0_c0_g2_i2.p1 TRINITY_DN0_c0_g2~~TRINITY_DN0_c0_g2_i2.p1  ORF type:complete len:1118 (-),score=455.47 TRINITY_DN0_c0_g2_i2:14-3367(-)
MVGTCKITINGQAIEVAEDTTIYDAASQAGIRIPTLCHHPRLPPAGKCGVCVVEVKGSEFPFVTSCTQPVVDGMNISTNSPGVKSKRIEAIRANIIQPATIPAPSFVTGEMEDLMLDTLDSSNALVRDPSLCVGCTRCVRACSNIAGMDVLAANMNEGAEPIILRDSTAIGINETDCISCGQCLNFCPTNAIRDNSRIDEVNKALDSGKIMVLQTAPAPRVAIAEEFGLEPGTIATEKMVGAAKAAGFHFVFDTNFTADLTIMEEAHELLHRLKNGGALPMFTSCCPGWVNMVEKTYPELIPNLSSCRSPMMMLASLVKVYWAQKMEYDSKNVYQVALMPCTAKKDEIEREQMWLPDGTRAVDAVLTTREFAQLLKKRSFDKWEMMPEEKYDNPLGESSGAAVIFGATGGVMEAALRTAYETVTGDRLEKVNFDQCRGMEGVKEFKIDVGGTELKCGVVHAGVHARKFMKKVINKEPGFDDFHFVEVMTCEGGCIGGGGQPRSLDPEALKKRTEAIYDIDERAVIRRSHENESVKKLYADFLGEPNSHKAHELLHTNYNNRKKTIVEDETTKTKVAGGTGGVLILYGSQGGTTAQAARALEAEVMAVGKGKIPVRCVPMGDYDAMELCMEEKVVMLTCTYGRGEFPDAAKPFWNALKDESLPENFLANVQFTVFGLGSSQYKFFCRAARELDARMEELGGTRCQERGEGDEAAVGKYLAAYDSWSSSVVSVLTGASKKEVLNEPPAPKYLVSLGLTGGLRATSRLPPPGYHFCRLTSSTEETGPGYDRPLNTFVFDLEGSGMEYVIGDHASIMPRLSDELVDAFLRMYGLEVLENHALNIAPLDPLTESEFPPSLTVRELVSQYLDLPAPPTKKFLRQLSLYADDAEESSRLRDLCKDDNEYEFNKFVQEYSTFEVLEMFKSARPPLDSIISFFPVIKPRLYSIASCSDYCKGNLELGIVKYNWETPSKRVRTGLCTGYLWDLEPKNRPKIAMKIVHGILYPPQDSLTPQIYMGLGSGIAPFRGFCQNREYLMKEEGKELGPAYLYFGCRYDDKDYVYGPDFERWVEMGVLTAVIPAFSRCQKRWHINHAIENLDQQAAEVRLSIETNSRQHFQQLV